MKNLGLFKELSSSRSSGKKASSSSAGAGQGLKQECVYQYEVEQPLLLLVEPPAASSVANNRSNEAAPAVMNHYLDGSSSHYSTIKSVAITC